MAADIYLSISFSSIFADESKGAWVTGPTGPPGKIYLESLQSEVESSSSILSRLNEFVDGKGVVDSTDFFIVRPAQLTEDPGVVLGIAQISSSFSQ